MARSTWRITGALAMAFGFFGMSAGSAHAGGCGSSGECYSKVRLPDRYATIAQPVVIQPASQHVVHQPAVMGVRQNRVEVAPGRWRAEHTSTVYGTVSKQVLVAPAQVRYVHTQPTYKTVHETVVVRPAGVAWERKVDCCGRETMCKVHTPAVTRIVERHVMVSQGSRVAEHVPAVYRDEQRTVIVQPAATRHVYQPPVHQWVAQQYVARPASAKVVTTPAVVSVEHRKVLVQHGGYAWHKTGQHW
jgi:hypothetical protein